MLFATQYARFSPFVGLKRCSKVTSFDRPKIRFFNIAISIEFEWITRVTHVHLHFLFLYKSMLHLIIFHFSNHFKATIIATIRYIIN